MKAIITKKEIIDWSEKYGKASAADLLLLFGPDGYDGTIDEYRDLLEALLEK